MLTNFEMDRKFAAMAADRVKGSTPLHSAAEGSADGAAANAPAGVTHHHGDWCLPEDERDKDKPAEDIQHLADPFGGYAADTEKAFRDAPSVIEGVPAMTFRPADTPTPASMNRPLITAGQAAQSPGNGAC